MVKENLKPKTSKSMREEVKNKDIPIEMGEEEKSMEESSETSFNNILSTIKDKQEEFGRMLSGYSNLNKKTLIDVIETDDSIIVKADLPRLKKEDIEIAISEDSIDIYAEFAEEHMDEEVNYIQRERSYGKISRSVTLPSKVKFKEAEGNFENSVLTVKIPKLEKETLKLKIE